MKRPLIRRICKSSTILWRGKVRPIVITLNTSSGLITVRPHGCRKTKTYSVADLFTWGPQLSFPLS